MATLAGFPIGKGRWTIEIADDKFTATANGATAGMLRVFASGDGNSAARGAMVAGTPLPAIFTASVTADKRTEEFRMTLEGGDVKEFSVVPEPEPNPERVPLTEAHRRGVMDPMTASLIRVPGNANLVGIGGVPAHDCRVRWPHAVRSAAEFQARGSDQRGEGLFRFRRSCARSILFRSRDTIRIAPR